MLLYILNKHFNQETNTIYLRARYYDASIGRFISRDTNTGKDTDPYQILTQPKKRIKGVTPAPNEWQIDHIVARDNGETNSYSNAQVISRKLNCDKWNK